MTTKLPVTGASTQRMKNVAQVTPPNRCDWSTSYDVTNQAFQVANFNFATRTGMFHDFNFLWCLGESDEMVHTHILDNV